MVQNKSDQKSAIRAAATTTTAAMSITIIATAQMLQTTQATTRQLYMIQ